MRLMHTSLPEFMLKMMQAAMKHFPNKKLEIKGLESLGSAKMQSLRTGRIESAVEEIANDGEIERIELIVMPRIPETMHTVIVKGIDKDGKAKKAILEVINIMHPGEEAALEGVAEVSDRRPPLGRH